MLIKIAQFSPYTGKLEAFGVFTTLKHMKSDMDVIINFTLPLKNEELGMLSMLYPMFDVTLLSSYSDSKINWKRGSRIALKDGISFQFIGDDGVLEGWR